MVADVPEGRSVYGIDFSGSIPKARYEELPKTEVEQISGKIDALSESINHLVTGSVMPMTVACSFIAETFTDDQAVQVPGLYPEWDGNGMAYKTGTRLRYTGVLYRVLQDHTSQDDWTPDASPALFAEILIPDPGVIPEWKQPESTNGYAKGDRVAHGGKTWESLVDNNVWEPEYPGQKLSGKNGGDTNG